MKTDIGVIGMAVMGSNLALNIESRGYKVSVFNRTAKRTEKFVEERAKGREIYPAYTLEEFVGLLQKPRKIILMVKAGKPTDLVIDALIPLLEKGDILIDSGNAYFKDTEKRLALAHKHDLKYIGMGVSGGESGALHGPSMMAGGDKDGYKEIEEIVKKAAAQTEDGPCVAYLGKGSAGHYVKMTHNGIEYAVMQILAEAYDIMHTGLGMSADDISGEIKKWDEGRLNSYLVEITWKILKRKDRETGRPMVDVILDKAGAKGTGKWTTQSALDLGVPVPSIGMAVFARIISSYKNERMAIAKNLNGSLSKIDISNKKQVLENIEKAVYTSILITYAQGMHLLYKASKEYGYGLDLAEVSRIWKGGCIVRAKLLNNLKEIYRENKDLSHLFLSVKFMDMLKNDISGLREEVIIAKKVGIPLLVTSSALDYFDSFTHELVSANIIQAQRDYFGAHTFERIDKEGIFHEEWEE